MPIAAIAKNTFKQAIHQPAVLVTVGLIAAVVFLSQFVTFFGLGEEARMLRDTSLATITVGGLLIAVFATASVVSDEIENRTAVTVLCKPVGRSDFIIGKYMGVLLALAVAYVVFGLVFCFTIWCHESPTVQGLFDSWWRNVPITQGELAAWQGQSADQPGAIAGAGAVIGALLAGAWLFLSKLVFWDFLKALVLSYAEVAVLAAAAVAFSTRLPRALNAVATLAFFVIGHVQGYIVGERLRWLLPDLESFQASAGVAYRLPTFDEIVRAGQRVFETAIPAGLLGKTVLYAVLYSSVLILIAVISFRRRELA